MDLVQDLQAAPIPIVTHYVQEKPQWSFFPWVFFRVISPTNNHIITTRIDPIKFQFPSSIDTLSKKNISTTILLRTSKNSKTITTPTLINLESLKSKPNKQKFKENGKITSVLVEGIFNSLFENRLTHVFTKDENINFQSQSRDNKMIIVSDGYFINNQFSQGTSLPLGFDKHTRQTYGNGEFIINCIDYLMENDQYIKIRSKNIALRLLNKQKATKEKKYWQIINFILPIIIISMITFIFFIKRRKRYSN
jgi:ABC-2 type transport system permease protein